MTDFNRRIRAVHLFCSLLAAIGFHSSAMGQGLVSGRSFSGSAEMHVIRPGHGVVTQQHRVQLTASQSTASFVIAPASGTPMSTTYRFLELPQGGSSVALFMRDPAASGSLFPHVVVGLAQSRSGGAALQCLGWMAGEDAFGAFWGPVFYDLQENASTPPSPPATSPPSGLPAFDGETLRVPAAWGIHKFEGWALKLARKYGTLPGGTTATVPAAWTDGVMQCHGTQGFVYEIPLNFTYAGFPVGSILYTPNGTWPGWEDPARWQEISHAGGYTKHVFR